MTERTDEATPSAICEDTTPAALPAAAVPTSPPVGERDPRARRSQAAAAGRQAEVCGSIDAKTGNAVLHDLLCASMPGQTLLVDLSMVDEIDGAGLEILGAARRQARMIGGDVVLTGVPEEFQELLADFITQDDLAQP